MFKLMYLKYVYVFKIVISFKFMKYTLPEKEQFCCVWKKFTTANIYFYLNFQL